MRMRFRIAGIFLGLLAVLGMPATILSAAESSGQGPQSKTAVVMKLGTGEVLSVRSRQVKEPPAVIIEFPAQRVSGALPERAAFESGAIRTVVTRYNNARNSRQRSIQSIEVGLRGPYSYQIRTEPGRVILEVEHPASINSSSVEMGLRGGTVIQSLTPLHINGRFRAMQDALTKATASAPAIAWPTWVPKTSAARGKGISQKEQGESLILLELPGRELRAHEPVWFRRWGPLVVLGLIMFALGIIWGIPAISGIRSSQGAIYSRVAAGLPSSMLLFDDLVWQAFSRQGHQLVDVKDIDEPAGRFRIVSKDGIQSAMLCVGNGPFFEKQTVEQFAGLMREAAAEQGCLIGTGAFTVPAQRFAKEHHITLMGREQLVELLSIGAMNEYVQKQLATSRASLDEAKQYYDYTS